MSSRDLPRRTFTAPQAYWDTLDEIVTDGLASSASGALRYVIDAYRRSQEQQALADSAGRLDEDDWLAVTGVEDASGENVQPWSQLISDQD